MRHARGIQLLPDTSDGMSEIEILRMRRMTFADVAEWERLGGRCTSCGHEGLVNAYQMRRTFGRRPLADLEPLLRCTICRGKGANRWLITKLDRNM